MAILPNSLSRPVATRVCISFALAAGSENSLSASDLRYCKEQLVDPEELLLFPQKANNREESIESREVGSRVLCASKRS